MKDSVYRSIDRLSYSSLKDLFVSFEYFQYRRENKIEPTKEMIFGSALHHMVLGTEQHVKLLPSGSSKSNKYQAELADLMAKAEEDDVFVSEEEYNILKIMQHRAFTHASAAPMFQQSEKEVPLFFTLDGIDFKAKLDLLSATAIGDPKSWMPWFGDENILNFKSTIRKSKYHLQAACYIEAAKQNGYPELPFYNIVFVKKPPYEVHVIRLSDELLQEGYDILYRGIDLIKKAQSLDFRNDESIITL